MGGMFTILKVRDSLTSYADPGWYKHPDGTRARKIPTPPGATGTPTEKK
jgi:hypothetical protein